LTVDLDRLVLRGASAGKTGPRSDQPAGTREASGDRGGAANAPLGAKERLRRSTD